MATITPVVVTIGHGVVRATWDFAGGDVCLPVSLPQMPDKTVEVTVGAIGTSSISIQGTSEVDAAGVPQNYKILHRPAGTALTYTTTAQTDVISENNQYLRPHDTVPGNGTGLRVVVTCRRAVTSP